MGPEAIFEWLLGEWSFVRVVPDQARMTGYASLMPLGPATALYREEAEIHLVTGEILRGEQRYVYRAQPTGFDVLFHDTGSLFLSLEFRADRNGDLYVEAQHPCGDDLYQSSYRIVSADSYEVRHAVTGPRKEYTLHTIYSRLRRS